MQSFRIHASHLGIYCISPLKVVEDFWDVTKVLKTLGSVIPFLPML